MPSSERGSSERDAKREAERRRRAAELLGEPDSSADDTDEGWGERPTPTSDEEYLRDVPPHHG